MKKSITEVLGIEYPIFQGAMAQIATHELAGAVSEAGGLGIIASGGMSPEQLRDEIRALRKMTSKPFAVNLMLMMPRVEELVDVICEEKVPVVTTGAGTPKKYMPKLIEAGVKVVPVIPNAKVAKKMEDLGAVAVVAEGTEAGGHIGEVTTMVLTPAVARAVSIPVVAAGGIASGAAMAAAYALGANGVQVGTLFLATPECPIADSYKQAVLNAIETSTVVTGRKAGHAVRVLGNEMTTEYLAQEKAGASDEDLEKLTVGSLRAAVQGDVARGSLMSGQSAGLVDEMHTCKEVIEMLIHDARETIKDLQGSI